MTVLLWIALAFCAGYAVSVLWRSAVMWLSSWEVRRRPMRRFPSN
jgi:hypothetical protein